jgi:hypothetical protein
MLQESHVQESHVQESHVQKSPELSDRDLEQIARLVEAATAGPWISYVIGRDRDAVSTCIELGTCNELGTCDCIELIGGTTADQDFIACARQYLPQLLLEVRTLRARMESLRELAGNLAKKFDWPASKGFRLLKLRSSL